MSSIAAGDSVFSVARVTPEEITSMRTLRDRGLSHYAIGRHIGRDEATVEYHLDPEKRERRKARSRLRQREHLPRLRAERRAAGLCSECGKRPMDALSAWRCSECLTTNLNQYYRKGLDV